MKNTDSKKMTQTDRSQATQSQYYGEAPQPGGDQGTSGANPLTQQVRPKEDLVATMPATFATDLEALLRRAIFESEQEARRINNMCEDAHRRVKESQEEDTSKAKFMFTINNLDKALWRCNKEFEMFARKFQSKALKRKDQEEPKCNSNPSQDSPPDM